MSFPTILKDEPNWFMWQPPLGEPDPVDPLNRRLPVNNKGNFSPNIDVFKNSLPINSPELFSKFVSMKEKIRPEIGVLDQRVQDFVIANANQFEVALALKQLTKVQIMIQTINQFKDVLDDESQKNLKYFFELYLRSHNERILIVMRRFEDLNQLHRAYLHFTQEEGIHVDTNPDDKRLETMFKTEVAVRSFFMTLGDYKPSDWNPLKDVEFLFQEIKSKGVIVMGGFFPLARGDIDIASDRFTLDSTKKALGWNRVTWESLHQKVLNKEYSFPTIVTVVGVKINAFHGHVTGDVIYTYPDTPTHPEKPDSVKFYTVPYDLFKGLVTTNHQAYYDDVEQGFNNYRARTGQLPTYGVVGHAEHAENR